jgi:phage gpG-like protein
MIAAKVNTKDETKKVLAKAKQGSFKSLGHAGAAIRLTAKRSIRKRKTASPEGQPPHTRKGQLRGAIMFAVEKENDLVVIGPDHSKVGESGAAHEHGGRYKRQRYPKRPFMGPALEKTKDRLPKLWAGSVKA